jgi:hypothetical protein
MKQKRRNERRSRVFMASKKEKEREIVCMQYESGFRRRERLVLFHLVKMVSDILVLESK